MKNPKSDWKKERRKEKKRKEEKGKIELEVGKK